MQKLNVLLHAANLDDDDRSVGGFIPSRRGAFPDDLARFFVQSRQRGFAAARRADERLAVNQRRFRVSPGAGLAGEVRAEIFLPARLARAGLKTDQVAIRAERVKEFPGHRWRRAGGGKVGFLRRISDVAEARPPDPFAVLDRERLDELVLQPLVAQQVETVSGHGGRRVAAPGFGDLPNQFRSLLRPFLEQAGLAGYSVSLRPAPLRPVVGQDRQCGGQQEQTRNCK